MDVDKKGKNTPAADGDIRRKNRQINYTIIRSLYNFINPPRKESSQEKCFYETIGISPNMYSKILNGRESVTITQKRQNDIHSRIGIEIEIIQGTRQIEIPNIEPYMWDFYFKSRYKDVDGIEGKSTTVNTVEAKQNTTQINKTLKDIFLELPDRYPNPNLLSLFNYFSLGKKSDNNISLQDYIVNAMNAIKSVPLDEFASSGKKADNLKDYGVVLEEELKRVSAITSFYSYFGK